MYNNFDFPKSSRLLNSHDYSQVFDKVDLRVSSKHFLLLCRKQNTRSNQGSCNTNQSRMGIIVAKKNTKLAVQRNRIKRLLRESFRNKRQSLPIFDIVVLSKKGVDHLDNALINEELQYLWRKLVRKSQQDYRHKGK